ncbi:MAG TPA: immunity 53 family protein [Vicinamibacteria bacterium]|nr:immunity 53 family protein [Vicinamibacteria bacterium]HRB11607.1 immunity 53 family protein [Vicinamibacteria bacterium]
MENELEFIQAWYRAQCDGAWEHSCGVKIDTLDNPGWSVTIDLRGTPLEHGTMAKLSQDCGPGDWVFMEVTGAQFRAAGDPSKLAAILGAFREWSNSVTAS